jgi:hypothetical protein
MTLNCLGTRQSSCEIQAQEPCVTVHFVMYATCQEYGIANGNKGSEWEEFTNDNAAWTQPSFQDSVWQ